MSEVPERCPRCRAKREHGAVRFNCGSSLHQGGQTDICRRIVRLANREAIVAVAAKEYYESTQLAFVRMAANVPSALVQRIANAEHMLEMALTKDRYFREDFGDEVCDAMVERLKEVDLPDE